jgi:hypothetical protein
MSRIRLSGFKHDNFEIFKFFPVETSGCRFLIRTSAPRGARSERSGHAGSRYRGSPSEPTLPYPPRMIDLGSIAGLHSHNHQLHAYCPTCDRWATLPLAAMIAAGQGSRRLPFTVRCRWCGAVGRLQVRPPVPTRVGSVGWVMPDTTHQTV